MPLDIRVIRNNETLELRWDFATLSALYTVAIKEQDPDQEYAPGKKFRDIPEGMYVDFSTCPIYYLNMPKVPLVARGEQTLLEGHVFDWMTLLPGDRIESRRVSK